MLVPFPYNSLSYLDVFLSIWVVFDGLLYSWKHNFVEGYFIAISIRHVDFIEMLASFQYFNSLNIYWVFILDFDVYFCMEGIFVPLDFHPNIVSLQKDLAFHQLRQSWMRLTGKEIP